MLIINKMMRKSIAFIVFAFVSHGVLAQLVIQGNAIATSPGTAVTVISDGDVINNSDFDFSSSQLQLSLTGTSSSIDGNFVAHKLSLTSGTVTLNGNMTVTSEMEFIDGIITVPETFKLLFTGNGENLIFNEADPTTSYVDGTFYQQGTGVRRFPVGDGSQALPLIFTDVKTPAEIGVRGFAENSSIQKQLNVTEVDNTRYWSIECNDVAAIQSTVSLYRPDISIEQGGTPVAVEADPADLNALDLGYSELSDNFVTSAREVKHPLIAIGRIEEVIVKIHDLVTPSDAGSGSSPSDNDGIFIENLFPVNKVTLMDRWGVVLKVWENYKNENNADLPFFQSLTPGNYICVVECTAVDGAVYKASQMVTILKTN
jgi:hypothetical protein